MTILEHINKIQENLNRMVDKMDDDTYYYDATYHLEQIKRVEQEPKIVPIAEIKFDDDKLHEIVEEAIKNIEIEPKWIPVSERLPETDDDVLVCDGVDMFVAWYAWKGMWQGWNSHDNSFERETPIIAWMPLPEPYKEG